MVKVYVNSDTSASNNLNLKPVIQGIQSGQDFTVHYLLHIFYKVEKERFSCAVAEFNGVIGELFLRQSQMT